MADVLRMVPVATEVPAKDPAPELVNVLDVLVLVAKNLDALAKGVSERERIEKSETSALVRGAIDGLHVVTSCRDCGDEFVGSYREAEAWTRRHRDEHLAAVALEVVRHGPGRVVPRPKPSAKPELSALDRLRKMSGIRVEPASEPVGIEKLRALAGVRDEPEPAPATLSDLRKRAGV